VCHIALIGEIIHINKVLVAKPGAKRSLEIHGMGVCDFGLGSTISG